jgi:hypothetical protein
LENLEKIRRNNGPNPASLPVDNKKCVSVTSNVGKSFNNAKASNMWCHYLEKNNHNTADCIANLNSRKNSFEAKAGMGKKYLAFLFEEINVIRFCWRLTWKEFNHKYVIIWVKDICNKISWTSGRVIIETRFKMTKHEHDLWIVDKPSHYEYLDTHVDNILIWSKDLMAVIKSLEKIYLLKNVGISEYYLGGNI